MKHLFLIFAFVLVATAASVTTSIHISNEADNHLLVWDEESQSATNIPIAALGLRQVRAGEITVAVIDGTTKAVAFSSPLPDSNYDVFVQAQSNLGVALWASTKTVNGFTLNVSIAAAGTISYAAVQR